MVRCYPDTIVDVGSNPTVPIMKKKDTFYREVPTTEEKEDWVEIFEKIKKIYPKPDNGSEGFFDLPLNERCMNPGHNFPTHLYIPAGKGYRHVCPGCGHVTVVRNPITW